MGNPREFLRRHALVVGIVLMFLLSWPVMLASSGVLPFRLPFIMGLVAGWGVSVAALIMTGLTLGRVGVIGLLKRFLIWRVEWKWYLLAFMLYPAIFSLAVLANSALTGIPADFGKVVARGLFGPAASLPVFILPFFLIDAITNGEELGWRGYVLARLQGKHSAIVSSLFVGVIWAAWHIPKFLAPGNTSPFALFAVKILADAILYTWLYNNTRGSLLIVTIFHSAGNTAGVFLPVATTVAGANSGTSAIQVLLEILVVIGVVAAQGPGRLSRNEQKQVIV